MQHRKGPNAVRTGHTAAFLSDWDKWTWSRWSSIGTRLVVDGRAFTEASAMTDAIVRTNENLQGELTLTLPVGPHTARLQWRTFGQSVREWTTFQRILDGFGSSTSLLSMVHTVNAQPVVTAPLLLSVDEDDTLKLDGIKISDIDSDVAPDLLHNTSDRHFMANYLTGT